MDGISTYKTFIDLHKPQLVLSGVPEHFWPILCKKLQTQIFDAGLSFSLLQIDYEGTQQKPFDPLWGVVAVRDIERLDQSHIYLIDHAWTFKPNSIKSQLRNIQGLLQRMCSLMQIPECDEVKAIDAVADNVWKYAQTYAIGGSEFSVEERVPLWYIMDELGSGIQHSDNPNFRTVPFIYIPDQVTFTLLFPINDVEEGDMITRNFVEGDYSDSKQREAMLIPWQHYERFNESCHQAEPDSNYFSEGHIAETIPEIEVAMPVNRVNKLKVYSEYPFINQNLTSDEFEIVDNENDADILWYLNHFKTFKELSESSPYTFINQFPFEYVITIKDLIAIVARRCNDNLNCDDLQPQPLWMPVTFNLKTELPQLVSHYMKRKAAGLDNHWICKPYNLARGLDSYITDNLNFLCRLPLTGPKIAQKYIENPVLFEREDRGLVKFDLRYVILLKSVSPTKVYMYKNFFLRFANKTFALNNFEDYEQHFTVMNYNEDAPLYRMLCADFINAWSKQYPDFNWDTVEQKIFSMFIDLFTAATLKEPPCGIGKNPQSRALYAADIMLKWDKANGETIMQPQLLEVNWMPDCQRACDYYPDFYNDIFSVLFLNKEVSTCVNIM